MGLLEEHIRFTHSDDRDRVVETYSTPSMAIRAESWADSEFRSGKGGAHSPAYVVSMMERAIKLLAAQREGIVDGEGITLDGIGELYNTWDIDLVADEPDEPDGAVDDAPLGQGASRGA